MENHTAVEINKPEICAKTWMKLANSAAREAPWDPRRDSGENPHGRRSSRKPLRRPRPRELILAVQGTLNSLLQHHSSKASVLQCSAFFIVQLSHPYMTTPGFQAQFWSHHNSWKMKLSQRPSLGHIFLLLGKPQASTWIESQVVKSSKSKQRRWMKFPIPSVS